METSVGALANSADRFAALESRMAGTSPVCVGRRPAARRREAHSTIGFAAAGRRRARGAVDVGVRAVRVAGGAPPPPAAGGGSRARQRPRSSGAGPRPAAAPRPDDFFVAKPETTAAIAAAAPGPPPPPPTTAAKAAASSAGSPAALEAARQQLAAKQRELDEARREAEAARRGAAADAQQQREASRAELDEARREAETARAAIDGMKAELGGAARRPGGGGGARRQGARALREALRERCFRGRAAERERLARESVRRGRLVPEASSRFSTAWVQQPGAAMLELRRREAEVDKRRAALDDDKKAFKMISVTAPPPPPRGRRRRRGGAAPRPPTRRRRTRRRRRSLADRRGEPEAARPLLQREGQELAAEKKQLERAVPPARQMTRHPRPRPSRRRRPTHRSRPHTPVRWSSTDALRLLQELDALPATLRECLSLPAEDGFVHEPHSAGSSVSGASSHAASSAGGTAAAAATTPAWAKTRRFVFLELIGSGGFAVVFRAYDLLRHEYVACKLHHVDKSGATRGRRRSYATSSARSTSPSASTTRGSSRRTRRSSSTTRVSSR